MKNEKLEQYFKLFTSEESENFFDNSLKEKQIHFVKREIPDSKFTEYFFEEKDLPQVEYINENLKKKEAKESVKEINTLFTKPSVGELIMTLFLIALIIAVLATI
jgi:hypothetical protein